MKRKVCLIILAAALVLSVSVGFLLRTPLVSQPDSVRPTYDDTPPFDDWEHLFELTAGKPWRGEKIKPFDLEIDSSEDCLIVTALSSLFVRNDVNATLEGSFMENHWKPRPPAMIHASKETQSVTLPDGETLAIEEIFTAYPTGPGATDWVSGFFEPLTLAQRPGKESSTIKPDRGGCHFWPQHEFPEMAFAVKGDPSRELNFKLFDMGTHQRMNQRTASGGNLFTLPLQQWHSSAFRLVIDLASGPIEEREMAFQVGASASFVDFELDVILVEKLSHPVIDHSSQRINWQNNVVLVYPGSPPAPPPPTSPPQRRYTWTLDPAETAAGTLVALSLSNIAWLPPSFELEASTKNGALVKETVRCDGNLVFASLPVPPEELLSLRVRYPSTWVRAVFEFDRIPGLPSANYGLSNLFDVHVPYTKSKYRPEKFISNCTKLKLGGLRRTRPGPTSFEYENKTVGEIAKDFSANAGIFGLKVVDGHHLEGVRSSQVWLEDTWRELRSKF